jgi:hypothetical protein
MGWISRQPQTNQVRSQKISGLALQLQSNTGLLMQSIHGMPELKALGEAAEDGRGSLSQPSLVATVGLPQRLLSAGRNLPTGQPGPQPTIHKTRLSQLKGLMPNALRAAALYAGRLQLKHSVGIVLPGLTTVPGAQTTADHVAVMAARAATAPGALEAPWTSAATVSWCQHGPGCMACRNLPQPSDVLNTPAGTYAACIPYLHEKH